MIGLTGPPDAIPDKERTGPPAEGRTGNTAWRRAEDAARASGVEIRELAEIDDLVRFSALVDDIWHPNPNNPPVTAELLRALAHAGNYVAGAFADDHLVGVCAGFFSPVDALDGVSSAATAPVRPRPPPRRRITPGASGVAVDLHLAGPFLVFSMNAATFACRAFKSGSWA